MITDFMNNITKSVKHKGMAFTVKELKQARLHVTRYLAGHPLLITPIRISLTKDGLPKLLQAMVPLVRKGNPNDLRIILTLLSVGRTVVGDGNLDYTSIVSPSSPTYNPRVEDCIVRFTDEKLFKVQRETLISSD